MKNPDVNHVLFLCSLFNGLSQKIWTHFAPEFQQSQLLIGLSIDRIKSLDPNLILCTYLNEKIPEEIWQKYPCLVVHPGPPEDRGPSSLSWALLNGTMEWGVTIFQADNGWDTGPVWATAPVSLELASISYLYRNQVGDRIVDLLPKAIQRFTAKEKPLIRNNSQYRKQITPEDLKFTWEEDSQLILRKIHAGDSYPGTLGIIEGKKFGLFGAKLSEDQGKPGEILNLTREGVTIAAGDGSLEIARIAGPDGIKTRPTDLIDLE